MILDDSYAVCVQLKEDMKKICHLAAQDSKDSQGRPAASCCSLQVALPTRAFQMLLCTYHIFVWWNQGGILSFAII